MKTRFIFLYITLFSIVVYSQNITNTLGTNGVLSITDNTTTFFSLHQNDGRITLADLQGSKLGFIFKGTHSFLHNYGPAGGY